MTRSGEGPADDAMAATLAPPSSSATVPDATVRDTTVTDATLPAPSTLRDRDPRGAARGGRGALPALPAGEGRESPSGIEQTVAAGSSQPGGDRAAAAAGPELPLADPSQYVSEREIARGGMGRIIAAHDRILGRPVALKELLHVDPEQAARFRREALITARLQHPAIVPVYQAGRWPSGEPFYAMKLVAGRPLDRAIADARTLTARLGLLPSILAAVDAIAYAHSHRVVHRDLKPANVLVGDFGEIVVIDWGLAKDLDAPSEDEMVSTAGHPRPAASTLRGTGSTGNGGGDSAGSLTVAGAVMGTPAYMPPEQARGEVVDERADVFALGAMLYHLLAGAPPYAARTATDVIAAAIAGQVVPLETRTTEAPADLVAIVQRAMAHEPADRYPSAQALAEELRRFQTGKLVAAHTYTVRERLARWVRRHKAAVTIGAIAVVTMAALGTLAIRRIVVERDRADQQRRLAEQRRAAAEGMVDFLVSDLRTRLGDIGRKDLLAGIGAQIRDYYGRLSALPGGIAAGDTERLATALYTLGEAESERGDPAAALAALDDGRARLRALVAAAPDDAAAPRRRDLLARILVAIGKVQHAQGQYDAEVATYREALALYDAVLVRFPDDRAALLGAAAAHDLIGDITRNLGRLDAAFAEYDQAMAARQRVVDATPAGPDRAAAKADLATSHLKLASTYQARGDTAKALAEYTASETLRRQLADEDPENTARRLDLARAQVQVADLARDLGQIDTAVARYQLALDGVDGLLRKDAGNATWRRERGITLSNWGYALIDVGDADGAVRRLGQARDNHTELVAKDPGNTSWLIDLSRIHFRLGDALLWRGDLAAALESYQTAKQIREQLLAKDPKSPLWRRLMAWSDSKISYALWVAGRLGPALAAGDRALDLRLALHAESPDQALVRNELALSEIQLGRVHGSAGRHDDALVAVDRGIAGVEPLVAADAVNTEWRETLVNGLVVRAGVHLAAGDPARALADAERAVIESDLGRTAAPGSAVWPALAAEARWLRHRATRGLGARATAAQRAASAGDVTAAHDALAALVADHRLSADKRPLWDQVRAAR